MDILYRLRNWRPLAHPETLANEVQEAVAMVPEAASEIERLRQWHMDAVLMRDAYQRENNKLREKTKRMFDLACEASAALEKQNTEQAAAFLARAKLAANC